MIAKQLIKWLESIPADTTIVSIYGRDYTEPQFHYADVYLRTDPSYILTSYAERPSNQTEQTPISALVIGLK